MKILVKKIIVIGVSAMLLLSVAACQQLSQSLDVVGKESVTSFDAVLKAIPDNVEADEINAGWSLSATDASARFIWSEDWSKSPLHDVMFEMDATPFLAAGLDPEKLPDEYAFYDDMLMIGTKFGNDALKYNGSPTPLASFEQIVNLKRDSIGYHADLDHYGINFGDGNMFEWAKDMSKNDKDIVFVLNPEPFINAGVDPNSVEGWVFAKVKVEMGGNAGEVDKLLKPFDLK